MILNILQLGVTFTFHKVHQCCFHNFSKSVTMSINEFNNKQMGNIKSNDLNKLIYLFPLKRTHYLNISQSLLEFHN